MNELRLGFLLNVVAAVLAGGSGWQLYLAVRSIPSQQELESRSARLEAEIRAILERGKARVPDDRELPSRLEPSLQEANLTGKVAGDDVPPPPPPGPPPLVNILTLLVAVEDGDESRVVICYVPTSGVEPPAEAAARVARGGPGSWRADPAFPLDHRPELIHHLVVGDVLWPPFERIRLVRVADDASHVFFVREAPGVPAAEWQKEKVHTDGFDLGQEMIDELHQWLDVDPTPRRPTEPIHVQRT